MLKLNSFDQDFAAMVEAQRRLTAPVPQPRFQQMEQQQQQQSFRAGYPVEGGIKLSDIDDIPMWSFKDLTSAKTQQFFNEGGGPNEKTSLLTANMIDMNKDYDTKIIEVYLMATDKAPFADTDLVLISGLLSDYYIQIFTNEARRSWSAPLSAIVRYPMAVAAAGASAYNPQAIVAGAITINMPVGQGLVFKGGSAFTCEITTNAGTANPTGLRMGIVYRGRRYALTTVN